MTVWISFIAAAALTWMIVALARRWLRRRQLKELARIEDAVKHLFHEDERAGAATLLSLSGAMGITPDRAAEIAASLMNDGLALQDEGRIRLTALGRERALAVIRRHRLYERFLADETGVQPSAWHDRADREEHRLTESEAEHLARRLGDPLIDPHGDPIPSAAGTLPSLRGGPLHAATPGTTVMVVHIEDEPRSVFQELQSHGLQPGVRFRVTERSERSVVVERRGRTIVLSTVAAANVTVVPAAPEVRAMATLESIPNGRTVIVAAIDDACYGVQRRRLLDLGFVPGTPITPELPSPGGDPVAYRVRGALVALRNVQAAQILVEPSEVSS
ncbi:MAG: DtxR family transcriptional regulator [Bacteroidetes bacterium]|jgi:DtxR family Mn-dependent transcriptional regulator|nr:DtxR family transcriptional regulator [Bacteroidota bacterium]